MSFLYLDESGDLGFDFSKRKTSRYFLVTVLIVRQAEDHRILHSAVERTIKNKILRSRKNRKSKSRYELKGTSTDIKVKRYFLSQLRNADFSLYAIVIDKMSIRDELKRESDLLYNQVSQDILSRICVESPADRITLTIDKSKNKRGIKHFNQSIAFCLKDLSEKGLRLKIIHSISQTNKVLQAVDLFSWGIFRKYERQDVEFYNEFSSKIVCEEMFSP